MSKLASARVICDVPNHGLKVGQIVEAEPSLIKALAADGSVDPHKDAVAYARSQNAPVMRSSVELEAERIAAAADALRVEIAQLEDLLAKAEDEATKNALAAEVIAKRADLAVLA